MKSELRKAMYDCFYIPLELQAAKQEIEKCHQTLIEALDKPERRLVLQIIDQRIVSWRTPPSTALSLDSSWRGSSPWN